jgi:hypothetical protein
MLTTTPPALPRAFPDPSRPKAYYLEQVRRHRQADELIRGTGWDGHRGCAIGCTLETYNHSLYPALLGVPEKIAWLEDWLFENLPSGHLEWPERFLAAIPEGADLSTVFARWSVRLLDRGLDRIGLGDEPWQVTCREAVRRIQDLHRDNPLQDRAADWSAAESAARSAAESADWSAARSAESADWSAESAARSAEIVAQAEDLLAVLAESPV